MSRSVTPIPIPFIPVNPSSSSPKQLHSSTWACNLSLSAQVLPGGSAKVVVALLCGRRQGLGWDAFVVKFELSACCQTPRKAPTALHQPVPSLEFGAVVSAAWSLGSRHHCRFVAEPMDYRRVSPQFRPYACLMQIALAASLMLYAVYRVRQIMLHAEHPPMESSVRHFRNAGMWRLCPYHEYYGPEPIGLDGIGLALPNDLDLNPDVREQWNHSAERAALQTLDEVTTDFWGRPPLSIKCAVINLERGSLPKPPTTFNICFDSPQHPKLQVSSGGGGGWRAHGMKQSAFTHFNNQH